MIWWARCVVGFGALCFIASFTVIVAMLASELVEWAYPHVRRAFHRHYFLPSMVREHETTLRCDCGESLTVDGQVRGPMYR